MTLKRNSVIFMVNFSSLSYYVGNMVRRDKMKRYQALHEWGSQLIELSKELNKLSDSGKIINEVTENEIEEQKKKVEDILYRIRLK